MLDIDLDPNKSDDEEFCYPATEPPIPQGFLGRPLMAGTVARVALAKSAANEGAFDPPPGVGPLYSRAVERWMVSPIRDLASVPDS